MVSVFEEAEPGETEKGWAGGLHKKLETAALGCGIKTGEGTAPEVGPPAASLVSWQRRLLWKVTLAPEQRVM